MHKNYHIENQPYSLPALRKRAQELCADATISDFQRGVWTFIMQWINDDEVVHLQTSGSTGEPKIIPMSKHYMRQSAAMTLDFFRLSPNDRALCCLPASYIAGKMMIVRALEGGLNLLLSEPNGNPLQQIKEHIDFVAMVPLQVENVLADKRNDLDKIHHLLLGGASLSTPLEEELQACQASIWHSYGMTETVSHIAMRRVNGMERTSWYSPMPGVSLSLDKRACLQVDAPHLSPARVVTNDLVTMDAHHRFSFVGRYDNVINTGGVKVSPELVEQKIAHLISQRFMISSVPDVRLGQRVILLIEGGVSDANILLESLKTVLSSYEMPKEIMSNIHFQKTSSGKMKRNYRYDL